MIVLRRSVDCVIFVNECTDMGHGSRVFIRREERMVYGSMTCR